MKEIIEAFFKAYYEDQKDIYLPHYTEEYGLTEENYWDVVMKTSTVTFEDFERFEGALEMKLPDSLKAFYSSYYSLEQEIDTGGLRLAGCQESGPDTGLVSYFFEMGRSEEMLSLGLVPFGIYNDEWYVCLDMKHTPEDPRIMLFESSQWESAEAAVSHRQWFSNLSAMLLCITDYMKTGDWENFDQIDPGHHYEDAYDYWDRDS